MQFILEGILFGLTLTILLGPIFIALTQTAIESGARAGLVVGLGIWVSDFIIITLCYFFINNLTEVIDGHTFRYWMGLLGGLILIVFGIGAFLKQIDLEAQKKSFTAKKYAGFWLKGFLVNTVNPFTFIFWIGVISTYIIGRQISGNEAFLFLSSILLTIIITDSAKVLLAKLIKSKLKARHVQWFNRIAGIGLFAFGLYLILQSVRW